MMHRTALVVDDSKLARITLRKKLEQRDMQVDMVASAQEAFAYLEVNTPDIIFMDHLMPDIDGFEATKKIKSNPETHLIPVIMCSGKENDNYLEEAQAIGAQSILSKPPEADKLDDILSAVPVEEEDVATESEAATDEPVVAQKAPEPVAVMQEAAVPEPAAAVLSKEELLALLEGDLEERFGKQQQTTEKALGVLQESVESSVVSVRNSVESVQSNVEEQISAVSNQLVEQLTQQQQKSMESLSREVEEQQQALDQRVSDIANAAVPGQEVDTSEIADQVSAVTIEAVENGLSDLVTAAIEERIPELTNSLSDQVKLQLTYQLEQLKEEQGKDQTTTVDQAMANSAEELRPVVASVVDAILEEQLGSLVGAYVEPQLQTLKSELDAQTSQSQFAELDKGAIEELASERAAKVVEDALSSWEQRAEQDAENRPLSEPSEELREQLFEMVTDKISAENALMQTKMKRLTAVLGAGVGVCLLLIVALGIA